MSDARQKREWEHRKTLRDQGWDIQKADGVRFNSGSETLEHFLAKAAIAWVAKQQGFRVASEVEGDNGECDLLLYGTEDQPVAVECETGWAEDVKREKLEKYVKGEPIRDILPVEVTEMPDVDALRTWADRQILAFQPAIVGHRLTKSHRND